MNKAKIKIKIPTDVNRILDLLSIHGYDGYVVGGCVRDNILNKSPNDWDICTNCTPEKMLDIFSSFKVIPTGLKHGTVTIVIQDKNYEVTTYRIDGEYKDGRHPEEVIFTTELKEDLKRRDFTINAMAYNHRHGLVDYYGGIEDIINKKVKCVGDPIKRFSEDYLRMLRGIRFSTQLEYDLDRETFNAIKKLSQNITYISVERIREELNKILRSNTPSKGIQLLNTTNLLKYILPELEMCVEFQQHNPYHKEDLFNYILSVVDHTENNLILRLSALFYHIGKPVAFNLAEEDIDNFYKHHIKSYEITKKIMKRLKYDNKSIEQVAALVKEHMSIYEKATDKTIKRLINRVGTENIDKLFQLQIADVRATSKESDINSILKIKERVKKILNEKQPLSIKDLKISGSDLLEAGVSEGKQIGIVLNDLMEIVLENPELNRKENLMKIVRRRLI